MSNLAQTRLTERSSSVMYEPGLDYGAAASTIYYAGLMQTLDSSARPKNPAAVGEIVAGVIRETVENIVPNNRGDQRAGGADYLSVEFLTGVFAFDAHATHPPTAADVAVFAPVYASDNHTLSRLASDGSQAGFVIRIEGTKVWAAIGPWAVKVANVLAGITTAILTGTMTGTVDGVMTDVAAAAAATAGGATPTAAQVDTGIATALAPLVIGINTNLKELQTKVNALIADLTS